MTRGDVTLGRNGTNGQATKKAFPDEAAAKKHADKLILQDGQRIRRNLLIDFQE